MCVFAVDHRHAAPRRGGATRLKPLVSALKGAWRLVWIAQAALLVAAASAAQAQLPRASNASAVSAATVLLDPARRTAPFVLQRQHWEIQIQGEQAQLLATFVYRNQSAQPVIARTPIDPTSTCHPPLAAMGITVEGATLASAYDDVVLNTAASLSNRCMDEAYEDAQFAEAGEADMQQIAELEVGPGEEISLSWQRKLPVLVRDNRYRLVLPLPARHDGTNPAFMAEVSVENARAVRHLASATHGGVVRGLGQRKAQLTIASSMSLAAEFLAVDVELAALAPAVTKIAKH